MGDPALKEFEVDEVILPDDPTHPLPWSKCYGTSQYGSRVPPPPREQCLGINNADKIADAIKAHQYYGLIDKGAEEMSKYAISDLVARLLTNVNNWASFSTTATHLNIDPPDPE